MLKPPALLRTIARQSERPLGQARGGQNGSATSRLGAAV